MSATTTAGPHLVLRADGRIRCHRTTTHHHDRDVREYEPCETADEPAQLWDPDRAETIAPGRALLRLAHDGAPTTYDGIYWASPDLVG